jgi:hypothetical protein
MPWYYYLFKKKSDVMRKQEQEQHHTTTTTTTMVSKGSQLNQWTPPYLIVPLHHDNQQHKQSSSSSSSMDDPTCCISQLKNLPRWSGCSIWEHNPCYSLSRIKNVKLERYLLKLQRQYLSNNCNNSTTTTILSWNILCLLTTLYVIESTISNTDRLNMLVKLTNQVPEHDIESTLFGNTGNDDHEEDDFDDEMIETMLIEVWPMIQEHIEWKAFRTIFLTIQDQLHMISIPHPLTTYAKETIFQLNDDEFQQCWTILNNIIQQQYPRTNPPASSLSSPHRLRASQLWLDQIANLPDRIVGVLLEDPLIQKTTTKNESSFPILQSCLPNTCLELVINNDDALNQNTTNSTSVITCDWIALYDVPKSETLTVSTRPKRSRCCCFKCSFQKQNHKITKDSVSQFQRLAHIYFQQEAFDDAYQLYEECHDLLVADASTSTLATAGDFWHSMAAVLLTQHKFIHAQRHWERGSQYKKYHQEIGEQLEKQQAYQYFQPLPSSPRTKNLPTYQTLSIPSSSSPSLFLAPKIVDLSTCQNLISMALDYAKTNGGWTTSRHYAVPTTDLPTHKVPRLLEWFQKWMSHILFPLLEDQFLKENDCDEMEKNRFYVHDAFLVRYEATASSHFLPLHYDESTHSCVLTLNDDYEGGGTYIYDLDQSITPPAGSLISFRGNKCLHGGSPVTHGIRYILAIFLYLDKDTACYDNNTEDTELKSQQSIGDRASKMRKLDDTVETREKTSKEEFSFSFF